ncbi:DUF11 domain-containing protein [filamentous cyanobacterium LEGE 11480]|uniref:DUF11 domain-containing protein n=1 Tax=Romeriopsis navalis LEGE 11480 TaxID=2777977 RepID=A0A928Z490_9CYAN|nr:hypothetical protein [Romeriopsis navalis]MBE9032341.1 DUF11 domain-containing protein [Romeriopsis navalis LEGE 11480]
MIKRKNFYAIGAALATAVVLVPFNGAPLLAQAVNQSGKIAQAVLAQPRMQLQLTVAKQVRRTNAKGQVEIHWQALDTEQAAVVPGNLLRYQITATNTGKGSAKGFVITQPIPRATKFMGNSLTLGPDVQGNITYSIDQGKTFSTRPMIQVKGKPQAAPAASYTHLRIRLNQAIKSQSTIAAQYQVRVK